MCINKNASAGTEARRETNHNSIITEFSASIKSKKKRLSFVFWKANYSLEENRQDYAARGHLWRQIGCCLSLIVFRIIGRVL